MAKSKEVYTNKEVVHAVNNALIAVSRWDEGVRENRARSLNALTKGLYDIMLETQIDDDGKPLFSDLEFTFCLLSAVVLSLSKRLPEESPLRNVFALKFIK